MKITKYETNKNKNLYFNKSKIRYKRNHFLIDRLVVNIYPDYTYQQFYGFGAAITVVNNVTEAIVKCAEER